MNLSTVIVLSVVFEVILLFLFIRMAHDVHELKEFIVNGKKPVVAPDPEEFEAIATGKKEEDIVDPNF